MPASDTALPRARPPDPDPPVQARCGTPFTSNNGARTVCDSYLIRLPDGRWRHRTDRCESCVLGLPDGAVCEWATEHHLIEHCADPSPRVCGNCGTPLDAEIELNGHPTCQGEPGECCGGCCWGAHPGQRAEPDPDDRYDAARETAFGLT